MIKETISYEDIDGNSKTMDAYFHLTMREMRQLLKDGIQDKLDAVTSGKASTDTMFDLIDELIKDEVQYYKDIYKEQGIKGLIESL